MTIRSHIQFWTMVASVLDVGKMTETKSMEMDVPVSGKRGYRRVTVFVGAGVAVSIIVVAAVFGALYAGHVITRSAYKDAQVFFKDGDGNLVNEEVTFGEKEVKFYAPGKFTVMYDYEHMLAVIRRYDEGSKGKCYVTKLTPDMGSMEEVRRKVDEALGSDNIIQTNGKRVELVASNSTVNEVVLNTGAIKLCGDLPIEMLEKAEDAVGNGGLLKRSRRGGIRRGVFNGGGAAPGVAPNLGGIQIGIIQQPCGPRTQSVVIIVIVIPNPNC